MVSRSFIANEELKAVQTYLTFILNFDGMYPLK